MPGTPAPTVRVVHTASMPVAALREVRALLEATFDDWSDHDWEHTLGGLHVLVLDGPVDVVAHAAVVQRMLVVGGEARRTGYVEGVAVAASHRGHGWGGRVMDEVETILDGAYPLGALSTSESARGFYERRGWARWSGPTSVIRMSGTVRTPDDDGGVYVRGVAPGDVDGPLSCYERGGDPW